MAGLRSYAQLPVIYLSANATIQFISPEPIQYVDISSKSVVGDLPLKNVLRIRLKDSITIASGILTIAGEKFIAQYKIEPADSVTTTEIAIDPKDTRPLDIAGIGLSQPQLKNIALNLFCHQKAKPIAHVKAYSLFGAVNHIYTAGDYFFIDLDYENCTNLVYDIDEFRFKVDDNKITKATNVQSVEVKPEFVLFDNSSFKRYYRNIFVFKKISFPGNKVLHIELNEKQISGRAIGLTLSYQDVLNADIVPNY